MKHGLTDQNDKTMKEEKPRKSYWAIGSGVFPTLKRAKHYVSNVMNPVVLTRRFEQGDNFIRHFVGSKEVSYVRFLPGWKKSVEKFQDENGMNVTIERNTRTARFTRVYKTVKI